MPNSDTNGTDATLRELHSLLVQAMAAKLKSGEEVKASYLDTVRKFLLDNDVRVENPQEYLGYLQGIMSGDNGGGGVQAEGLLPPIPHLFYSHDEEYMAQCEMLGRMYDEGRLDGYKELYDAWAEKYPEPVNEFRSTGPEGANDGYGFQR